MPTQTALKIYPSPAEYGESISIQLNMIAVFVCFSRFILFLLFTTDRRKFFAAKKKIVQTFIAFHGLMQTQRTFFFSLSLNRCGATLLFENNVIDQPLKGIVKDEHSNGIYHSDREWCVCVCSIACFSNKRPINKQFFSFIRMRARERTEKKVSKR